MWQDDGVSHVGGRWIREVAHIAGDEAVIERLGHGLLVHEHVTSQVEHHDATPHLPDGVSAYHPPRLIGGRHVDRDVVTLPKDLIDVGDMANAAIEPPCGVDGEVRVIAQGLHAKARGRVGDDGADGAQADDAEPLARQLDTREPFLDLLGPPHQVRVVTVLAHPLVSPNDVATCKQHAAKDQLLDSVCIGTRGVEDDDALLGAALEGDVVDSRAGTGDGKQPRWKRELEEVGAPHHDGVGLVKVVYEAVALSEAIGADLGDVVHAVDVIHVCLPCWPVPYPWSRDMTYALGHAS